MLDFLEKPGYVLVFEYGEAPSVAAIAAPFGIFPYLFKPVCHYHPFCKKRHRLPSAR
jgi:hypothetical protein